MADPNKPKSGPDPSANPVEQALSRLRKDFKDTKAVDGLKEEEMRALQARLKKEMQEKSISATAEQLDTLVTDVRMEALERRLDGVNRAATEQENQAAEDVANLYRELRTLATEVGPGAAGGKSFFSKEGFGEGMNKSLKKLGELAGDIGVILDQIKESIASSIGAHIDTLKPFIGEDVGTMLEKFIGKGRIELSKALDAANPKISLPMESFIHARKTIDKVRKETGADSRGWNAERMTFFVVQKLSSAGITGKEDKGILEQKITDATNALSAEVIKSPMTGTKVDFVDAPKPSEKKFDLTINGRKVLIQESGSVEVAGKKWQLQKEGVPVLVRSASPDGADALRLDIKRQDQESIVILGDIDPLLGKLATNATDAAIPAQGKQGESLEFKRA